MNPQKELQQIQDLSLKLDIPIWKNSIELPSRDKKKHHTFAIEKKFFFTWSEDNGSEDNQKIIIFISTQTNLIEVLQYSTFLGKQHEFYLTSSQLIRERIHQFEVPESASQNNFVSVFLTELLETASQKKATDIHFAPTPQDTYNIQIRVDGKLQPYKAEVIKGVVFKVKLLSQMDVAKNRFPQDGYMNFQNKKGKKFDVRVATIPSVLGEKMVIRILPLENLEIDFKKLNFPKPFITVIEKLIASTTSGWILVTGPTGSGKTTTLYSIVRALIQKNLNIITIEDPVEYRIDGVTQVQVNEKAGITFSSILRASLRQDPDVILVGEIRDEETAKIAAAAAKTGHLVLSTIHSSNVLETLQRMKFFQIAPEDLANSLKLIISQRLLKSADTTGRVPVLEYLENNREIRDAILEQKTILEIEKIMKKQKFISMQDYAKKIGVVMQN